MKRIIPLMLLLIIGSNPVNAQIPQYITFQGVLTEADGNPKPDGNYSIDFKIYDQPSGGTSKYSQNESVSIRRGVFSVKLGPLPATLRFDVPYYLGITVSGGIEMSPRIALNSTPYSLSSVRADTAKTTLDGGITSAKIASGSISDGHVASGAAIAGTKITPNFGSQNITTSGSVTATSFSGDGSALTNVGAGSIPDGSITSTKILDGTITNADINATAGIATSKISGTVTSISGHGLGSLATKNTVDSSTITDGSITNADIRANAGISGTKINPDFGSQNVATTGNVTANSIQGDGGNLTGFMKIRQIVQDGHSSQVSCNSEETKSVISLSLNVGSTTNHVLIQISSEIRADAGSNIRTGIIRLKRNGATTIKAQEITTYAVPFKTPFSMSYVDSPNSSSLVTYELEVSTVGSSPLVLNFNSGSFLNGITMTLMEIAP